MNFRYILDSTRADIAAAAVSGEDVKPWFMEELGFESEEDLDKALLAVKLMFSTAVMMGIQDQAIACILLIGHRIRSAQELERRVG